MAEILHITAHLGGGVGKVLSRLVETSARLQDGWKHTIVCLEQPEKDQFSNHIKAHGGELLICPSSAELNCRLIQADIVQVEWWHHPAVARWLCAGSLPPMRLLIWSHVSGLHPPAIPIALTAIPHRFIFSSHCSLRIFHSEENNWFQGRKLGVVYSSGGFDDLPAPAPRNVAGPLRAGYIGALNFAKLHPNLMDFLAAVNLPKFKLTLIGDPAKELLEQASFGELANRIDLRGYSQDVKTELAEFDVLVHLLNPQHYGTTENALLEAMSMGVVPVVLNNPAERCLVKDRETGMIVNDPHEFSHAISWLAANPIERIRMSEKAAQTIRKRFSAERTRSRLCRHYKAILSEPKRGFDFRPMFGMFPADWFRACQGESAWRFRDEITESNRALPCRGPFYLYEKTKSSVFHYRDAFPSDTRLQHWARDTAASLECGSSAAALATSL